jgi:hypothetical protein
MSWSKWFWAAITFAIVLAVSFVPAVGALILVPVAAVLTGGLAAHFALRTSGGSLSTAVAAGASAGTGALVASIAAFALLGFGLGLDPGFEELVRAIEPHPEAGLPHDWIAPVAASIGALLGLLAGVGNLVLATVAGLVTAWFALPSPSRSLKEMVG